jgi:hypothetical protein
MYNDLTAAAATERQERLIREAAEYRRSGASHQPKSTRRHRFAALVKDLAAASL